MAHACEQVERGDGRLVNLVEVLAPRVFRRGFGQEDLGEAANDRQLVPEIVPELLVVVDPSRRQTPAPVVLTGFVVEPVMASDTAWRRAIAPHGFSRKASRGPSVAFSRKRRSA